MAPTSRLAAARLLRRLAITPIPRPSGAAPTPRIGRRAARRPFALLALALAGCAGPPHLDAPPETTVELRDVPFFPQTEYQCGPAALATILSHEGVPVTADDLARAVYVEGLRGSLQAELLAATRRHGLVPYTIEPEPAALFAALELGKPVLVLQNLGFDRFPVWHYAVVVGYDAKRETVLLRSGTERRRAERLKRFLKSWQRAGHWGFVAAAPDDPPASADAQRWIRALADAERLLPRPAVSSAYTAAKARWPREPLVLYASAVHDGAAGRWQESARGYLALLEIDPLHAAARNNLANMLAEGGCVGLALREARAALRAVGPQSPIRGAVEDTAASIERLAAASAAEPSHCAAFAAPSPPVEPG